MASESLSVTRHRNAAHITHLALTLRRVSRLDPLAYTARWSSKVRRDVSHDAHASSHPRRLVPAYICTVARHVPHRSELRPDVLRLVHPSTSPPSRQHLDPLLRAHSSNSLCPALPTTADPSRASCPPPRRWSRCARLPQPAFSVWRRLAHPGFLHGMSEGETASPVALATGVSQGGAQTLVRSPSTPQPSHGEDLATTASLWRRRRPNRRQRRRA